MTPFHQKALTAGLALLFSLSAGAEGPAAPKSEMGEALEKIGQQYTAPEKVEKLCTDLRAEIKTLGWKIEPCEGITWKVGGESVEGRPIVYAEFGDPNSLNTTLIFSAVHGDEVTPVYIGIELVHWVKDHQLENPKTHVVIAPLVNPDGFFHKPRTRMNARGVDVNRNFKTSDWDKLALRAWKGKFRSDPRRFPGNVPGSEPETQFQEELIRRVHPAKILSVHSPLNFVDYDGPTALSLARFPREYVRECLKLRTKLKAITSGFFPGSLGNFAGRELGIPTITLELPTAKPELAERYWKQFSLGIRNMIDFEVPNYAFVRSAPVPW